MRYVSMLALLDLILLWPLAESFGFLRLLAIVLATGVIGAAILRRQGLRTLSLIRGEIEAGRVPADELSDSLGILLAGGLLLWPGLLGDVAGLALLFAPVRRFMRNRMRGRLSSHIDVRTIRVSQSGHSTVGNDEATGEITWESGTEAEPRLIKHVDNRAVDKD